MSECVCMCVVCVCVCAMLCVCAVCVCVSCVCVPCVCVCRVCAVFKYQNSLPFSWLPPAAASGKTPPSDKVAG